MSFPKLTFPLTVDFCSDGYWINDQGPFKYGAATTAFFIGEEIGPTDNDGIPLLRELEQQLRTFGGHLHPYVQKQKVDPSLFLHPEDQVIACSMCFAFHPIEDNTGVMAERYVFSSLRDFLYVELGKAIAHGNAPRQCRLCGRWFLHERGDRMMYCERAAPGETEKTCREAGARVVFENKIQNEGTWKIYKRAYKKYYARVMKGNMSREDFNAWVEHAAAERDFTIEVLKTVKSEAEKKRRLEELKEKLNRQ